MKLRLHGIDAQERKQICSNAEGENYAYGKQTTDWLRHHIKTGDHLFCDSLDIDKYRWLTVRCFKSGENIHQAMLRTAGAVAYTPYWDDCLEAETGADSNYNGL